MAVYFQFKSSIVKESIPIAGPFVTVGDLKESIIERKQLRRGKRRIDSDLIISDYHTKVDYLDDRALIPCYTTVLVGGVPVQASFPIMINPPAEPEEPEVVEMDPDDLEWEELISKLKELTRKDHNEPKATSVSSRKNTMASVADDESSDDESSDDESSDDDDMNFKRRPSWYK